MTATAIAIANTPKFQIRQMWEGGPLRYSPEYEDEFQPNILVRNWQSIPLEAKREDWIDDDVLEEGRFIPGAVLRAMRRRAMQDPNAVIRRMLKNWRDVFIINDEAHHVYGEKKTRKGEEPGFI